MWQMEMRGLLVEITRSACVILVPGSGIVLECRSLNTVSHPVLYEEKSSAARLEPYLKRKQEVARTHGLFCAVPGLLTHGQAVN